MKKLKTLLAFMIIICALVFTGCASVSYTLVEEESGGISQIFQVEIDSKQLVSAGATSIQISKIKTEAKKVISADMQTLISNYNTRIQADDNLSHDEKEYYLSGVKATVGDSDNTVTGKLTFESVAVYYSFYEIDPNQEDDDEDITTTNQGLFYVNYIQSTKTIFSNQSYIDRYAEYAQDYIDSLGLSYPDRILSPTYSYAYQTTNRKLKTDCDVKTANNGVYTHTWYMSKDETQRDIHFYTVQPKRWVWYAFALGGAVVLVGGLFLANFIISKRKKKTEVEIIEP